MSELLSEALLRSAASWSAFKQGRELLTAGRVRSFQRTEDGWSGAVQAGKALHRLRVVLRSASDLDARCSCPENRFTGEFCAHAVATGLACLTPAKPAPPAGPSVAEKPAKPAASTPGRPTAAAARQNAPAAAPVPPSAWEFQLPARWHEALRRGILAVRAQRCSAMAEVSPADEALATWLAQHGLDPQGGPHHLHLRGDAAGPLLAILSRHPRARLPGGNWLAEAPETLRLPVQRIHPPVGGICRLQAAEASDWREFDGTWWRAGETSLERWGGPALPAALQHAARQLAESGSVELPCLDFLGHLPLWREWLDWPEDSWTETLRFHTVRASFPCEVEGDGKLLRARLLARYPEHEPIPLASRSGDPASSQTGSKTDRLAVLSLPVVPADGTWPEIPICDLADEARAIDSLRAMDWEGEMDATNAWDWRLAGPEAIDAFLVACQNGSLARRGIELVPGPRLQSLLDQTQVLQPQLQWDKTETGGDKLKLSFQTNKGARLSLAELREMLRGGGAKQAMARRRIQIDPQVVDVLLPVLGDLDCRQDAGWLAMDARAVEVIQEIQKKWFESSNHQSNQIIFPKIPETLQAELRGYQAEGYGWLVDRVSRHGGALLADDMGLGKTIQTIACIERLMQKKPGVVLVVVPASLMGNWRAEWRRFAPDRRLRWMHGPERDAERERVVDGDVLLTTYGTLARDLAWHLGRSYRAVVADEASLLRNPDTDHAKAMCRLKTEARIALTGTPIENRVSDLWSVFRFLQPGWLGGREHFRETYEQPIASGNAGVLIDRLKLKISPFVLRRTKEQVAADLPAKWVLDEFCELSEDQREVYRSLQEEGLKQELEAGAVAAGAARMRMLTALLRLRQACCDLALLGNDRLKQLPLARRSAKMERLMGLLEEARDGGHRVLVFSQFRSQLLLVEEELERRGWDSLRLDGQTRDRQRLVERFQAPEGPLVFLISLKAGGYGLNLTAADVVIHMDPWWNPAAEAQATDRAHRIGQERPVTVYRLLTRGTVEEMVVGRQADKRAWAALVDEAGQGDPGGWSAAELAELIRHDFGR
jgi:superfamily II DNA or RNA helicase